MKNTLLILILNMALCCNNTKSLICWTTNNPLEHFHTKQVKSKEGTYS